MVPVYGFSITGRVFFGTLQGLMEEKEGFKSWSGEGKKISETSWSDLEPVGVESFIPCYW